MHFLPPKAERYGLVVSQRLENEAYRAYDQYKIELEKLEVERLEAEKHLQSEEGILKSDSEGILDICFGTVLAHEDLDEDTSSSVASKDAHVGVCGKFCEKLCTTNIRPYTLRWWEFLPMLAFLNTSITYSTHAEELSVKWGAILFILMYIVVQILVTGPLYMTYMFLASYSRRSYIKFWDCVPLIKGLGYSVLLTGATAEVFNVSFTGLTVIYIFSTIIAGEVPWANCDFPNAHPDCMPVKGSAKEGKYRHNATCCCRKECGDIQAIKGSAKYSSLDYYMSYILQRGYEEKPQNNGFVTIWIVVVVILWVVLCFLMTIGLRKYRKIFGITNIVLLVSTVPAIILTILYSPKYALKDEMEADFGNIINGEMWLDFIIHDLYRVVPSDVVALSALSVPAVSTTSDTVILSTLSIFWCATGLVWTDITAKIVERNYQIQDEHCVVIRGDYLIFVLIPDLLGRLPVGHLFVIGFFITVFLWNFSISLYILTNVVEAILDEFPVLHKFRLLIALLVAATGCALNIQVLRPTYMDYFELYIRHTFPTILSFQLITAWIGMSLYSVRKIIDDYHFTFARRLSVYWATGIKLGIVMFFIIISLLYLDKVIGKGRVIFIIAVLWPIPAGMAISILRYYMRANRTLLDSHPMWGPSNKKKRFARALFDPAHDLRYRSNIQRCKHHCLIRTVAVRKEIYHWHMKYEMILSALEDEGFEFFETHHEGSMRSIKSAQSRSSGESLL